MEAENNKITLPNEVQSAIEQVLKSFDPLDRPDFNSTDYINQLFPNEQSLSNINEVISKIEVEISMIDDNIRTNIRGQCTTGVEGKNALEEAKKTIQQLFSQITEIKSRAEITEDIVKGITCDIKQLDNAKKNLTTAITTLNHLHMLVGGIETLKTLTEKRIYGEIINPLQAITEVNQHFSQYNEIPQIKEMSNSVQEIHRQLATQITEDFKNSFSLNANQKMSLPKLKDACLVVSVLDGRVKRDLLKWFINLQLQEYVQLFHENQDISWLDKIDKRYAWIKRHLLDFEDKYGNIFPLDWEVSERIAVEFCHITRSELSKIMSKRRTEIDVKLLLYAINKTSQFEDLLGKRFNGSTLDETLSGTAKPDRAAFEEKEQKEQTDETNSQMGDLNNLVLSPFRDLIGASFKPYLDIYTDSIDRNLNDLIEKFLQMSKQQSVSASLESCAELFIFYKKSLVQCTQLSNGKNMFDLALIFKKYLREYAAKVLENQIPKVTQAQTSIGTSMSMSLLNQKDFKNLQSAANQVIHSFLKEGEIPRYTKEERIMICKILTTAEYCLETVQQLEDKLKEKIDVSFVENIDLSEEKDVFHRVISQCIQLLVSDLENLSESALVIMTKVQFGKIESVGDQSPYVNSIISHFKQIIPVIRDNLASSRKYYTQFCHKFINSFIPKFINYLYKCRPTNASEGGVGVGVSNIMGCEQLLLDTHSLKTVLLDLPTIESQVNRKAPASYAKTVIKGMTKAEMIIKIVMAPVNPHNVFIEQYLKLLPDNTLAEFHKVCDMKGIKKVDQIQLIELYKKMAPKTDNNSSYDSNFDVQQTFDSPDNGRIKKLENLIKKRLPN